TGMEAGGLGRAGLSVAALAGGWGVVRPTPLDGVLALFAGVLALSTLASGHPLQASGWARLWIVLAYFVVFWWLRDRAHAVRLARVIVGAGALAAAYGILQHFTGADWYRTLLGRPTYVHPREAGTAGYAVVGFFRNYLTFAHVMIFPLAWALAGALAGRAAALGAALVVVLALAFSTARGAWRARWAVAAALPLVARARRARLVLPACAVAAGLAFAVTPALRAEAAHMFSTGGANAGRVGIYRANLDIVHERPILGLGFGRYRTAAPRYYAAHPAADRRSHAHNNFLQMAAEAGLTGLAAFGHASTVAAHPEGPLARAAGAAGARIIPLGIANHFDVRAALVLRRLAPGFDVVHFHTARAHALAPLSRGRGARLVVTRRMDYVPAGGPYVRFLYNRAVDAVIAISEGVRTALIRVGVRAERIRVVPSGIDARALAAPPAARAAVRREWGLGDDEVAVVALGALEVRKGHAVLLAAAAGLTSAEPRLRYGCCGEGRQ